LAPEPHKHRLDRRIGSPAGEIAGLKPPLLTRVGPKSSVIVPVLSAAVMIGASLAPVKLKVSVVS